MTSNSFTHECHNHNDHKVFSLNTKSIFQWTRPGQFWTDLKYFCWPAALRQNPWMPLAEPLGFTKPQLKNTAIPLHTWL